MMKWYTVPHSPSSFQYGVPPRLVYLTHNIWMPNQIERSLHSHDTVAEVVFVLRGHGWHRIEDTVYRTSPGDMIIKNRGVLHDERAAGGEMELICCGITDIQLRGLPQNHLADGPQQIHLPSGEHSEAVRGLLVLLERLLRNPLPQSGELAQTLCASLVVLLRTLLEQASAQKGSEMQTSALVSGMRHYIDENFERNFTLDELAERFSVSRFYASRRFRKEMGYSPMQYRLHRRLGQAQSLLTDTEYPISFIANAVGYDDANHFTQRFTKVVGVSPSEYRQKSRQHETNLCATDEESANKTLSQERGTQR